MSSISSSNNPSHSSQKDLWNHYCFECGDTEQKSRPLVFVSNGFEVASYRSPQKDQKEMEIFSSSIFNKDSSDFDPSIPDNGDWQTAKSDWKITSKTIREEDSQIPPLQLYICWTCDERMKKLLSPIFKQRN